jgi:hypothetical protein
MKRGFEEAKELRNKDEIEIYLSTAKSAVRDFMNAFKSRNWGTIGISTENALHRGRHLVRRNPFAVIVEPFMDPENGKAIYGAVQWARRQERHGSGNENAPRQLNEIEEELRRQQGGGN